MGFKPQNHDQASTSSQSNSSSQEFRGKKRKHSIEFKIKAVKLCLEPGASCQKIAGSLNLKSSLLYGWLKIYRDNNYSFPENPFSKKKKSATPALIYSTQNNGIFKNQTKKKPANGVANFIAVQPSQILQSHLQRLSFNGLTELVLTQGDVRIQLHYPITELAQLSNLLRALRS
jgi:transposase-like protein